MDDHVGRGRSARRLPLVTLLTVALASPVIVATHWAKAGWQDKHYNYPSRPSGYTQIVNRFGQPCNANASVNRTTWRAADTGSNYTFRFHKKLGGYPSGGGTSTNLDNDVWGHINNNHLTGYVKHGIYGYLCRYIRGTTKWSTHAFGIAVDVSSAEEYQGKCTSSVNRYHKSIWEQHGWYWGLAFCDPMHFQYATSY